MNTTSNVPTASEIEVAKEVANAACKSRMFPHTYEQAFMILLIGRDLGLSTSSALMNINLLQGKPTFSAGLIKSMIFKTGLVTSWEEKTDETECVIQASRKNPEMKLEERFTLKDAERARLTGRGPWQQYPKQMLLARCVAAMGRRLFPEVASGLYEPAEFQFENQSAIQAPVVPQSEAKQPEPETDKATPQNVAVGWNREEQYQKLLKDFRSRVEKLGLNTDCSEYNEAYTEMVDLCAPLNRKSEFRKSENARISALAESLRKERAKANEVLEKLLGYLKDCDLPKQVVATLVDYAPHRETLSAFRDEESKLSLWELAKREGLERYNSTGGDGGAEGLSIRFKNALSLQNRSTGDKA
jgi:hypothetical protein